jgi:photosynthetic reaction center cytochrome c subunit
VSNHFHRICRRRALAPLALALLASLAAGQTPPSGATPAEQAYKNIQVLKNTPADELIPTMRFMSSALGVHCEHCHVENAYDKDDKKPKQQARQMMQMMFALNHNNFSGKKGITCFTCHRGQLQPRRTPTVSALGTNSAGTTPEPAVDANQAVERYINAIGGLAALKSISTEQKTGTVDLGHGIQFPVDIFVQGATMRCTITHLPTGESIETVQKNQGWSSVPGRPLRDLSQSEIQAERVDADPPFLADLQTSFTNFDLRPETQIDGHKVYAIRASNPNGPLVRLYIDQQSGLLLRLIRYVDTPLGRNPTQIDYSDYRDVNGIKLPFRYTVAQPQGSFSVQLNRIVTNAKIDDSRFAKPSPAASSTPHP